MTEFLVESPHTKAECMDVLDDMASSDSRLLGKFEWGCAAGDHRGWATLKAERKEDVKNMIPSRVRSKASVVPVTKFSAGDIRKMHAGM